MTSGTNEPLSATKMYTLHVHLQRILLFKHGNWFEEAYGKAEVIRSMSVINYLVRKGEVTKADPTSTRPDVRERSLRDKPNPAAAKAKGTASPAESKDHLAKRKRELDAEKELGAQKKRRSERKCSLRPGTVHSSVAARVY